MDADVLLYDDEYGDDEDDGDETGWFNPRPSHGNCDRVWGWDRVKELKENGEFCVAQSELNWLATTRAFVGLGPCRQG